MLRILLVADEWDSSTGGITTFNRELAIALAAAGQQVHCLVPSSTREQQERAEKLGVRIEVAPDIAGLGKAALAIPWEGDDPDVIVGHGRILGPFAHAQYRHHSKAHLVHVVHMDPHAIEPLKDRPDVGPEPNDIAKERMRIELDLARAADSVFAVGPRLKGWIGTELHTSSIQVHELLPGLSKEGWSAPAPPLATQCLVFGRAEDAALKGIDIAVQAAGLLLDNAQFRDVRLVVMGLPRGHEQRTRRHLESLTEKKVNFVLKQYTSDRAEVLEEIRQSSLVLMPSREEGFGLSGLEAIGEGIPVLISRDSGLAQALEECALPFLPDFVVDLRDGVEKVAERMARLLRNREIAFAASKRLREAAWTTFDWTKTAQRFLEVVRGPVPSTPSGSGIPPSSDLATYPQKLVTGRWIERPELVQLEAQLRARDTDQPVILVGPPGAGKSAALAWLTERLQDEFELVVIKADRLPVGIDSLEELTSWLRLPSSILDYLDALARTSRVVLVIDQLDALADFVDLHTRRLDLLIELLERAAKIEGVSVVASSRKFELDHDGRFRALPFQERELALPTEEVVANELVAAGVAPENLTHELREFLRVPHWLNVFVGVVGIDSVPTTVYGLFESFWSKRVSVGARGAAVAELAIRLATRMAEEEQAWLGSEEYRSAELTALLDRKVLVQDASGLRVGFAHQTFQAHCRVRSFLNGESTLLGEVKRTGGSLFVRPTLWAALGSLRLLARDRYIAQVEELLGADSMRVHVQVLVAEHLGRLENPSDQEVQWLEHLAEQDGLARACFNAIAGNRAWFEKIRSKRLGLWMRTYPYEVFPMVVTGWQHDPHFVLSIVERIWIADRSQQRLALDALSRVDDWEDVEVELLLPLATFVDADPYLFARLATTLSRSKPQLAAKFVTARLRSLHQHRNAEAGDSDDFESARLRHSVLREGLVGLELGEFATSAPLEFAETVMPWFVEATAPITDTDSGSFRDYRFTLPGSEYFGQSRVAFSLQRAIVALATTAPDKFHLWAKPYLDVKQQIVQALLARGYAQLASAEPKSAIQFLLADSRRLELEASTVQLLTQLAPHLEPADASELCRLILSHRHYETREYQDPETRRSLEKHNRRARLRLLQLLPTDLLTPKARSVVDQESRVFPDVPQPDARDPMIESPVSAAQLQRAKDDHIINLFDELSDETGFHHPRSWEMGGAIQASRELEQVVKEDPARGMRLLHRLDPSRQQTPARAIIDGLVGAGVELEELESAVLLCSGRGFASEEFRSTAAYALRKVADRGLSDSIVDLLSSWIEEATESVEEAEDPDKDPDQQVRSVLWRHGGGTLPRGHYPILSALRRGLLRRDPPDWDGWIARLVSSVDSVEVSAWRALIKFDQLASVPHDKQLMKQFANELMSRPDVRDSPEGVSFVAGSRWWVDPERTREWTGSYAETKWPLGQLAFGELVGLLWTQPERPEWTERLVGARSFSSDVVRGLLSSAAHLSTELGYRPTCDELILQLVPDCDPGLIDGLLATPRFRLVADDRILLAQAVVHRLSELSMESVEHLVTESVSLVPMAPQLAVRVVSEYLERYEAGGSLAIGSDVVDVALALARTTECRLEGVELFDRALRLGIYGTAAALRSIDRRPGSQRYRRR